MVKHDVFQKLDISNSKIYDAYYNIYEILKSFKYDDTKLKEMLMSKIEEKPVEQQTSKLSLEEVNTDDEEEKEP